MMSQILQSQHLMDGERGRYRVLFWTAFMGFAVTYMTLATPHIDILGHVGGVLGGILVGILASDMDKEDQPPWYDDAKVYAKWTLGLMTTACLAKAMMFTP